MMTYKELPKSIAFPFSLPAFDNANTAVSAIAFIDASSSKAGRGDPNFFRPICRARNILARNFNFPGQFFYGLIFQFWNVSIGIRGLIVPKPSVWVSKDGLGIFPFWGVFILEFGNFFSFEGLGKENSKDENCDGCYGNGQDGENWFHERRLFH